MKIIRGRVNANFDRSEHHHQASLPPSAEHGDKHEAEMQFGYSDPNTNVSDFSDQPSPPAARPQRAEVVLDFRNSVSIPVDSDSPSTEPPRLSQSPSIRSHEPQYSAREARTHPSTVQSILPFAVDRCFIIASSSICLYYFSPYILPSSLDIR